MDVVPGKTALGWLNASRKHKQDVCGETGKCDKAPAKEWLGLIF